jgi:hypothetical protein
MPPDIAPEFEITPAPPLIVYVPLPPTPAPLNIVPLAPILTFAPIEYAFPPFDIVITSLAIEPPGIVILPVIHPAFA